MLKPVYILLIIATAPKKFAMHVSGLTKRSFAQAMAGVAATEHAHAKARQKEPTEKEMREPSTLSYIHMKHTRMH